MVVTDIRPAQKSAGQHVYVDGEYAFTISDLEYSARVVVVGQELSADEVAQYTIKQSVNLAYRRAIRYIGVRPRSVKETKDYLRRLGIEGVDEAVERLEKAGLLDDRAFADSWVRERVILKPKSRFVLKAELLQKGVSRQIIEEVLEGSDEEEAIKSVIEKKRRVSRFIDKQKLTGYLLRQGFDYDIVKKVLEAELVGGDEPIS
jgi:regulatory protein